MAQKEFWIDSKGQSRPVIPTGAKLQFKGSLRQALRVHIHQRDEFTCQYCNIQPIGFFTEYNGKYAIRWKESDTVDNEFQIDHIIPRQDGGSNHPDNLQLLCNQCNAWKRRCERIWRINKKKGTPNDYRNWVLKWVPGEANA